MRSGGWRCSPWASLRDVSVPSSQLSCCVKLLQAPAHLPSGGNPTNTASRHSPSQRVHAVGPGWSTGRCLLPTTVAKHKMQPSQDGNAPATPTPCYHPLPSAWLHRQDIHKWCITTQSATCPSQLVPYMRWGVVLWGGLPVVVRCVVCMPAVAASAAATSAVMAVRWSSEAGRWLHVLCCVWWHSAAVVGIKLMAVAGWPSAWLVEEPPSRTGCRAVEHCAGVPAGCQKDAGEHAGRGVSIAVFGWQGVLVQLPGPCLAAGAGGVPPGCGGLLCQAGRWSSTDAWAGG
jgi:hypothetical protein